MRNCFVNYRGGAFSRAGFAFVGRSKESGGTPWLIPFKFSATQQYCLEFGQNYMRVIFDGALVTETPISITGISQANPAVVTATNTFSSGDWVYISGVGGMTELNNITFEVGSATGSSFTLLTLDGNNVNSSTFTAFTSGGTVARIFTLSTPYNVGDLPLLKYTQSADVMYLTHSSYAPMQLTRLAADDWTITNLNIGASISPPGTVTVAATVQPNPSTSPPTLPTAYGYVVTAVDTITGQESLGSSMASVTNAVDMAATNGSNIVNWSPVSGVAYYNVYRTLAQYNTDTSSSSNAYPPVAGTATGFVGSTIGTTFVDNNTEADFSQTPPTYSNPFAPGQVLFVSQTAQGSGYPANTTVTITSGTGSGFVGEVVFTNVGSGAIQAVIVINGGTKYASGDTVVFTGSGGSGATATLTVAPATGTYPSCVGFFQERLTYANSNENPDTLWFSQPGKYSNFDVHQPVEDGDAITVSPFGQEVNGIQFLVPMPGGLVVLTGLQAWQILGPGTFGAVSVQAITPSNISAIPQAYNGINPQVPPYVVNYDILYVQSRGSVVRDLSYNFFANIYTGTDLTILSSHLFQNYQITSATWAEEPWKLYWAVRSDGTLLAMTYLKEQEVNAWSRHDSPGVFQCVCSITEQPVDTLYAVVQRQYASSSVMNIERIDNRLWETSEDPFCIDSGIIQGPETINSCTLECSSTSGSVLFETTAPFFNSGMVGYVIRVGGGIAVITNYVSSTFVDGTWIVPLSETIPGTSLTNGGLPGAWSIGPQFTQVTGLGHLIGLTVNALADGVVVKGLTVTSINNGIDGAVTLPFPASLVKIGLPFVAQLQSVYLDGGDSVTIQGRRKNIHASTIRVAQSAGLKVGTNQVDGSTTSPPVLDSGWSPLYPVTDLGATYTTPGGATAHTLYTGDLRINLQSEWRKTGQVAIQQDNPLPMSILAIVPEVEIGDTPEATIKALSERQQPQGRAA